MRRGAPHLLYLSDELARELRALLESLGRSENLEQVRDPNQELPRPLTPREISVLTAVAGGLSNAEVARLLYVSPATVKVHMSRIQRKLQARGRTHAAVKAVQLGIITVG